MRHCAWIILLMLLFTAAVLADTPETPAPWPPDPTTIFAEGVHWSMLEDDTEAQQPAAVELDYERSIVRVRDEKTDRWREYPYSLSIPLRSLNTTLLDDGRVSLWVFKDYSKDLWPGEVFILDPSTGVYTEPPTVCEGKVIQAEASKGKWVIAYHDEEKTKAFLCQSKTGEQHENLPPSKPEWTTWTVYTTPNPTRLILAAQVGTFDIYAYDLTTDQFTAPGTINSDSDYELSVGMWMSDSRGLMFTSHTYSSWPSINVYSFDLDVTNGVQLAFWAWYDSFYSTLSPKRLLSVVSEDYSASHTGSRSGEHTPCTLFVYDVSGLHSQELGYECISSLIDEYRAAPAYQNNDFLYYLVKYSEDGSESDLFQYDMANDSIFQIAGADEFEAILSVSPDDRYIVVLVDDNGILDFPWEQPQFCCHYTHGRRVTILSTETGQIVYQSEPLGVYRADQIIWTDESSVVITANDSLYGDDISKMSAGSLMRVHFEDDDHTTYTTSEYGVISLEPSADHRYGLSPNNLVLNLETLEAVPFLREPFSENTQSAKPQPEAFNIFTQWQDDGRIKVTISQSGQPQRLTYLVTLPDTAGGDQ